jgi:peptidoglycan/xylan/chitin deacetylase (PgdA/CDA1 family)
MVPSKICFVSIDAESDFARQNSFKGVEKMGRILTIFKKQNIPSTIFTTGLVLKNYAEDIKEWSEECEIACHGLSHKFWNTLEEEERKEELEKFIHLYQENFGRNPKGFRAPSHLIDEKAMALLQEYKFLYDSSVVPNYPLLKRYRGYEGRAPSWPYFPNKENCRKEGDMKILEIPVTGLALGVPLAGAWIGKSPLWAYGLLFKVSGPDFLTLSLHSWDSLSRETLGKTEEVLSIIRKKGYTFLSGEKIYLNQNEIFPKDSKQGRMEKIIR